MHTESRNGVSSSMPWRTCPARPIARHTLHDRLSVMSPSLGQRMNDAAMRKTARRVPPDARALDATDPTATERRQRPG